MRKKLEFLLKKPVNLTITDNRRSIISAKWVGDACYIRLHHMFLNASDEVLEALTRYITHQPKTATKKINVFIRENECKIRRSPPFPRRKNVKSRLRGKFFDLQVIYENLNQLYFDSGIRCNITWGNQRRMRKQKSLRLGSYSFHTETIRVHPALDRSFVPDYVLNNVVYHEMLHAFLGIEKENGRNYSHHPKFKELEKRCDRNREAEEWIRLNLNRLISPLSI